MNPLLETHLQADAETQAYDQITIISTFGVPQLEYASIRKSAGVMDLPQRGLIELTGKDRHTFLNNLISNEVWSKTNKSGLKAGETRYAFLLNLKGRVVLDMRVIEMGDRTLLDVDARLAPMLAKLLERYLFAEQVKVVLRTDDLHQIALHGPHASEVLLAEGLPDASGAWVGQWMGVETIAWRDDVCGVPGVRLAIPTERAVPLWNHLMHRHGKEIELGKRLLRPVGWAAFNAARIEAGTPLFGIDFELAEPSIPGVKSQTTDADAPKTSGVLPAETGLLDRAVSFTKGCYLGQEVVARMHARQQVARRLVGLRINDNALPVAGEHVFDHHDNQIGAITSSTMSPMLSDAAIALAIVKKPHFETGNTVIVAAEGAMREAKVVDLPFIP